jgi:nicotinamidase-related amidase
MKTTAILVIDVQTVLSTGPWAVHDAANVISRINGITQRARAAGVPVVLVQHEEAEGPMQHGGAGWPLAAELQQEPGDIRLRKTGSDAFHLTDLDALLKAQGVQQLVICGFQSDFCVDSTTRRALALGYPVLLVADGHATLDNGLLSAAQISAHHTATLSELGSYGPRVRPVAAHELQFED